MATQSVSYCTTQKLPCCPIYDVILCVPTVLMESGFGFMQASMTAFLQSGTSCGQCKYTYTFEYDDVQLVDPTVPLTGVEISGVICKDCLVQWIEAMFQPIPPEE